MSRWDGLRAAFRELFIPPRHVDDVPQSFADQIAVRADWIRRNRPDRR